MEGIVGQPLVDVLYGAPAGLQDADFTKSIALVGGDASGVTVTVSPVDGQPDAYTVMFTPPEPGDYSLEVATLDGANAWDGNYTVSDEPGATTNSVSPPVLSPTLVDRVLAKGFVCDMFGVTDDELSAAVETVVGYKILEVRGEFGDAVVDSDDGLLAAAVERAIVELSTAEMWQRRKAYIMRTVADAGEARTRYGLTEENAARTAKDEATAAYRAIETIAGINTGFSFKAEIMPI